MTTTYTDAIDLTAVTSLDELLARMDPDVYEQSDGSYTALPTWGPETARVTQLIHASGPSGDIASWDTRAADPTEHRYLRRYTDAGKSYFHIITERDLRISYAE